MVILAWSVLVVGCFIGVVGTVVPALPGLAVIAIAALIHKLMLPEYLSWWTLVGLGIAVALSFGIDLLGTVAGAKWGGATKWGLWGAAIGGLVGIFFGLPGLILGPLMGAFVGEILSARRSVSDAAKAGVGAGVGIAIATVLRLLLALIVIAGIVVDCFL